MLSLVQIAGSQKNAGYVHRLPSRVVYSAFVAGASPFIAAAFQRYCELPPGERKTFERVLRKCVISGIESTDDDADNTAGGGSNTITQTGNNNNASIG